MLLRPPTTADLDQVLALSRSCYPERPEPAPDWQKAIEGPVELSRFHVAVDPAQEQFAGYGCLRPDRSFPREAAAFRLFLAVAPAFRQRGVGSLLLERLLQDLRELGAKSARVRVRDTEPDALAFLERRGFSEHQRMLFLTQALGAMGDLPVVAAAAGITITTLKAELEQRPDCLPLIHECRNACFADVPSGDPFIPPLYEHFTRELADPLMLPDCFFLARSGDRYVGLSYAASHPTDRSTLAHRFTGVIGPFRGQGIARALKLGVTRYALAQGYQQVTTATLNVNGGMRAVNEALGFTVAYREVRLERSLG